jgi:hypothetical protein
MVNEVATTTAAPAAAAAAVINHGTCQRILSDDLSMSRVTHHSVPHVLTQDQRDNWMRTCGDLADGADKDGTFLNWIITGDETMFS